MEREYVAISTTAKIQDKIDDLAFLALLEYPDEFVDAFPSSLPLDTVVRGVFVGQYRDDGTLNLFCTYGVRVGEEPPCFDIARDAKETLSWTPGSPEVFAKAKELLYDYR